MYVCVCVYEVRQIYIHRTDQFSFLPSFHLLLSLFHHTHGMLNIQGCEVHSHEVQFAQTGDKETCRKDS